MSNLNDFVIENGVLKKYNGNDECVVIPDGITKIGDNVFSEYRGLKKVVLPEGLEEIGTGAFFCTTLEEINIPSSVTTINSYAFSLTKLRDVVLPPSVTTIASRAYTITVLNDCIKSIKIYGTNLSIGGNAFPDYTDVDFYAPNASLSCFSAANKRQIIYTFLTSDNLYSEERVEEYEQFINKNHSIFELTIKRGDVLALAKLLSIRKKMKAEKIDELLELASNNHEMIAMLLEYKNTLFPAQDIATDFGDTLNKDPYSVAEIKKLWTYEVAEDDTVRLTVYRGTNTDITIPPRVGKRIVTAIGKYALSLSGKGYGSKIRLKNYEAYINLSSVVVSENIKTIENGAFRGCDNLKKVTLPASVTTIGSLAFSDCTSLASITIPNSVTEIGSYAFKGCTSLASITIPNSVTEIGSYAFEGCTSLANITIPDSVTKISDGAFLDCTSLASITIPDSVTEIGKDAFSGCTSLASITIPDSVTKISDGAFYDCTSLASITIPDGVTEIGESAFDGCASLTSITLPDGVTEIGEYAFYGCASLTSITIPDGVTEIGEEAFRKCTSLASITIPDGVKKIGDCAFSGCKKLKIHGPKGSYAETYAKENNIPFEAE